MPIEFSCPSCHQIVRTPDAAAGKKGRCPNCQGIVQIPQPQAPAAAPEPAPQPAPSNEPIEFSCNSCHQIVTVPALHAGKKGRCPNCQAVIQIPKSAPQPTAPAPQPQQKTQTNPVAVPAATNATGKIDFRCPTCGHGAKAPASAAGLQGQCPKCKSVVQIPKSSQAAPKQPAPTTPAPATNPAAASTITINCPQCGQQVRTPASAAGKKGKCPQCQTVFAIPAPTQPASGGLAPADAGGLEPIDGGLTADAGGGLEPMDGGLEPMGGALEPVGDGLESIDGGLQPMSDGLQPVGGGLEPISDGLAPMENTFADPLGGGLGDLGAADVGGGDPFAGGALGAPVGGGLGGAPVQPMATHAAPKPQKSSKKKSAPKKRPKSVFSLCNSLAGGGAIWVLILIVGLVMWEHKEANVLLALCAGSAVWLFGCSAAVYGRMPFAIVPTFMGGVLCILWIIPAILLSGGVLCYVGAAFGIMILIFSFQKDTLEYLSSGSSGGGRQSPAAKSANPYSAPAAAATARRKSNGSGSGSRTATMVCGILLAIYAGGQTIIMTIVLVLRGVQGVMIPPAMRENMSEQQQAALVGTQVGMVVAFVFAYLFLLLMLGGAIQMARLKTWGLALTACILALLPCNCPLCFGGLALGIWGITMLCLPSVRKAF